MTPELPALMRVSILSLAAEAAAREGRPAAAEEGPASPTRAFFLAGPEAVTGVAVSLPARLVRVRGPAAATGSLGTEDGELLLLSCSSSACCLAPTLSGLAFQ